MDKVKANGKVLLKRLRKAAGPKTRIVGITYPDVILGAWVGENPDQELAKLSVVAFQSLLNPALKEMYESVGGRFVDVTKATGAYTPLEQTTTLAPYGEIPVAVAEVCKLTAYCAYRDIHPNTEGLRADRGPGREDASAQALRRRRGGPSRGEPQDAPASRAAGGAVSLRAAVPPRGPGREPPPCLRPLTPPPAPPRPRPRAPPGPPPGGGGGGGGGGAGGGGGRAVECGGLESR